MAPACGPPHPPRSRRDTRFVAENEVSVVRRRELDENVTFDKKLILVCLFNALKHRSHKQHLQMSNFSILIMLL